VRSLTQDSAWVREHQNIFLLGPTGIGKFPGLRWREGLPGWLYGLLLRGSPQLFRDLGWRRPTAVCAPCGRLARLDVWWSTTGRGALADASVGTLEICEDRYQRRSMILTSQLPVGNWHEQIGDPTLADSILDRLVHNAHRIEMRGESMRKKRGGKE
jgi:hypothetical protein